jgi:hypothetical protein
MRKLEEDNRFYSAQWDTIHHLYPGQPFGPGRPSRRFDETDSDSDTSGSWQSLQGHYKACSHTDVGIPQQTILYFGEDFL